MFLKVSQSPALLSVSVSLFSQVPEAPIGSHRQRLAPTRAAVSPVEDFERDNAERNTTFIAHASPVHQDPLENWRDGTASALGHVPELGRTPE